MASSSVAFLFLLCFRALQARKTQRAARARMITTVTGIPMTRTVLGRSTEGRVGTKVEVGTVQVGFAVGQDVAVSGEGELA